MRHEIDSVHDFAWSAWDRFRDSEWSRSTASRFACSIHPVTSETRRVTLDALRFALPHFSRRYGAYPYPVLTVVHPPEHARNAGGMEYPTLITTGGPWFTSLVGARSVEAVTIHELGHQWFYGLLATDEHAWPFLDEGLTSYAEWVALGERFGKGSLFSLAGIELSETYGMRALAAVFGKDEPVAQPRADFSGFRSLGALVYGADRDDPPNHGQRLGRGAARARARALRAGSTAFRIRARSSCLRRSTSTWAATPPRSPSVRCSSAASSTTWPRASRARAPRSPPESSTTTPAVT